MSSEYEDRSARRVEEMNEREVGEFLRRSSVSHLECAINLMMTHMSAPDAISVLEAEIDLLREHG